MRPEQVVTGYGPCLSHCTAVKTWSSLTSGSIGRPKAAATSPRLRWLWLSPRVTQESTSSQVHIANVCMCKCVYVIVIIEHAHFKPRCTKIHSILDFVSYLPPPACCLISRLQSESSFWWWRRGNPGFCYHSYSQLVITCPAQVSQPHHALVHTSAPRWASSSVSCCLGISTIQCFSYSLHIIIWRPGLSVTDTSLTPAVSLMPQGQLHLTLPTAAHDACLPSPWQTLPLSCPSCLALRGVPTPTLAPELWFFASRGFRSLSSTSCPGSISYLNPWVIQLSSSFY